MIQIGLVVFAAKVGFDLVFVRHAETVANATGQYSSSTIDRFSSLGESEVKTLTTKLEKEPFFDRIFVSPSPRALRTIAPYLRATHQRATIWPLLYECCTGHRPADAHPLVSNGDPASKYPKVSRNCSSSCRGRIVSPSRRATTQV